MIIPTEGFFGISAATGGLAGTVFLVPTNCVCFYQPAFNLCKSEISRLMMLSVSLFITVLHVCEFFLYLVTAF